MGEVIVFQSDLRLHGAYFDCYILDLATTVEHATEIPSYLVKMFSS